MDFRTGKKKKVFNYFNYYYSNILVSHIIWIVISYTTINLVFF